MSSAEPRITVCMPAYQSAGFISKEIESVRAQTFAAWRLVIAVDGNDGETAAACQSYCADPRVRLVLHQEQLGWVGNLNYGILTVDTEYFMYWQHDDWTETSYLSALLAAMDASPQAAIAFSHVVSHAEDRQVVHREPSRCGGALERVKAQIELCGWGPFRGLVRAALLPKIGPLRERPHKSALEDLVWLAHAAREGAIS